MEIPTRKCWSLLGRSGSKIVKPLKNGVVVATRFLFYRADQLATDLSLKGFFASGRQAASAKGVKSPAAKKDESAITPLGWQNLIEVSGNLCWQRGENAAQGVESIRHAILGPYRASFGNAGVREPLFTL